MLSWCIDAQLYLASIYSKEVETIVRLEQYTQPFASSFYKKYLGDAASLSSFFHYDWNQKALNHRINETNFSKHKRTEL